MMICDKCRSTDTYVKDYEHNYVIKGKEIKFIAKRRFCKKCDSLVYDPELDNTASEIAISQYNRLYGVTSEEIIELRKKYNLSQELFSKIIGCAKKTLISYEKGTSIPNDCYLIVIKSLMSRPETITTFIEANKDQFTGRELDRINSKLLINVTNNVKGLFFNVDAMPTEYNGYTKISKSKIYNMILYFADKTVFKTKLLKEMFYSDFLNYKNVCSSITGLEYAKLTYGPVPDKYELILNQAISDQFITCELEYKGNYECLNIIANKKFDASVFTKEELEIMKRVKEKFLLFGSKEIADYSHREKAFTNTEPQERISYDYAFDIDI